MEPLLTTEEVARMLNTTDATVRRWLRNGTIPAIRVEGEWRIRRADLEEYIQKNTYPKKGE